MYLVLYFLSIICVSSIYGKPSKCPTLPCPPVNATICVGILLKKEPRNEWQYVMMSQCERDVLACDEAFVSTVVPLKYCRKIEKRTPPALRQDESVKDPDDTESPENDIANEDLGTATDPLVKSEQSGPEAAETEELGESDSPSTDSVPVQKENSVELKKSEENPDERDSAGNCPQSCPTRDVMVCARCSHKIYRTFMSACYMRMYQCQNPNERLELVSRHACLGSSPYLGEMIRPKENLAEPQDHDPVLGYIYSVHDSSEENKHT